MQLLSALDQIIEPLWAALCLSVTLVAIGVAVHVAGALLRRPSAGASALRAWLHKVFETGAPPH